MEFNMKNDEFGDRMKAYEATSESNLDRCLPVYARLDGRSFSKFTKDFVRPFDAKFHGMMVDVTKQLVKDFSCDIGYTQSDEISVGWKYRQGSVEDPTQGNFPLFSGRVLKIATVLASKATAKLNQLCYDAGGLYRYEALEHLPSFDCRIFTAQGPFGLPNIELTNAFVWRMHDAKKNSISAAARSVFSHKALQGKSGLEMKAMMFAAGHDFHDELQYPTAFKVGTFVQKQHILNYNGVMRSVINTVSPDSWSNTIEMDTFWFSDKE